MVAQMPEPESLLTIGDVAARARHLAKEPFAFTERCRHWAKIGLLVAVENAGAGAGKHALFRASEAYMAAVVNAFAESGLQPAGSRPVADAQGRARVGLATWLQERAKGRPRAMRLEIRFYPGGRSAMSDLLRGQEKWKWTPEDAALLKAKRFDPTSPPMTVITLDLGLLFASVFEAGKTL
jgi:hypothetical protein